MAGAFTTTGQNRIADYLRNGPSRFPTSWWVGLGTAASDSGITEVAGAGYGRVSAGRSLYDYTATQGDFSASDGDSHRTYVANELNYGNAGAAWGTITHLGFFDAQAGGACWLWVSPPSPLAVNAEDSVRFTEGTIAVTLGLTGGMSDWLANHVIDDMFRGQEFARPAAWHFAYATSTPTNATPGTEPNGGGYQRSVYPVSFGTLSSTVDYYDIGNSDAGTTGRISNNNPITFPAPTANQGNATHVQIFTPGGEFMFWRALAHPKTLSAGGEAPRFDPGELKLVFE